MTDPGWRRLDARMIAVDLARSVLSALPATVALLAFDVEVGWSGLWPLLLVAAVGTAGAAADALRWVKTRYRITDELVERRTGLLLRRHRSVRRDRIRSVDVAAEPRHRLAGMRIVRIGAGQQNADNPESALALDAVSVEDAELLRRELLRRDADVDRPAGSSAGTAGRPTGGERELARVRWRWIAYNLVGTRAYVLAIGVLWGAFWLAVSVGIDAGAFVAGVLDPDRFGRTGLVGSAATVFVVLTVVGVASLASVFVAENRNFRLVRLHTPRGSVLRTTRGLLSTREIDRDDARLRGVRVNEPLLWRWIGMADTDVISTGLTAWSLVPATTVLPRGPVGVALRVAAEILGTDVLRTPLARHPRAALGRRLFRAAAWTAVGVAVAFGAVRWAGWPGWLPWLGLAALPPAGGLAYAGYDALGHARNGEYLVFRSGALNRATVALRSSAVAGWTLRQSPLQRRLGLLTVTATTAAGSGAYAAPDAAERDGIRLAVAASPDLLACSPRGVVTLGEPLPIRPGSHDVRTRSEANPREENRVRDDPAER